ncbi:MAG: hypothetical protein V4633_00435 [Pseudomonadota bacterium]
MISHLTIAVTLTIPMAVTAGASAPSTNSDQTASNVVALQGIWRGSKKRNTVLLVRPSEKGGLEVHGQDSVSGWSATCSPVKPGEFECKGSGQDFKQGPFTISSLIKANRAGFVETWSVDGLRNGQPDKLSGTDQFKKLH